MDAGIIHYLSARFLFGFKSMDQNGKQFKSLLNSCFIRVY